MKNKTFRHITYACDRMKFEEEQEWKRREIGRENGFQSYNLRTCPASLIHHDISLQYAGLHVPHKLLLVLRLKLSFDKGEGHSGSSRFLELHQKYCGATVSAISSSHD